MCTSTDIEHIVYSLWAGAVFLTIGFVSQDTPGSCKSMASISSHAKKNGRLPALLNYSEGSLEVSTIKSCSFSIFISFISYLRKRIEGVVQKDS